MKRVYCLSLFVTAAVIGVCYYSIDLYMYTLRTHSALSPYNTYIAGRVIKYFIPLFHTGPECHEFTRIDKYLDAWLNRTQFVKILTDPHSP